MSLFSPLTDAIFSPLAAQQQVVGARFNAADTANKVLLDVASLYIDLIGVEAILEARRVTAAEADLIAASVAAFAQTGQGRKADADRADADRRLFQVAIQRAEERVAVASARLAERLNLDPSSQLKPIAGPLEPLELIDPAAPPDELIRDAVARRPDLAAREALVAPGRVSRPAGEVPPAPADDLVGIQRRGLRGEQQHRPPHQQPGRLRRPDREAPPLVVARAAAPPVSRTVVVRAAISRG